MHGAALVYSEISTETAVLYEVKNLKNKKIKFSPLKEILNISNAMRDNNTAAFAASSAFFFILTFFPLAMLLMSLLHYTNLTQEQLTGLMETVVPPEMFSFVSGIITEVYGKTAVTVSLSALIILWTSGKGFMALKSGMDAAAGTEKKKNYFFLRLMGTANAVVFMAMIILSLALGVFGKMLEEILENHIEVPGSFFEILVTFRKVILIAVFVAMFTLSYRFTPDWKTSRRTGGKKIRIMSLLPGAAAAGVAWQIYSALFSLYIRYTGGFENMYGSLATFIAVMLWFYGCMYILLAGMEINVWYITWQDRNEE